MKQFFGNAIANIFLPFGALIFILFIFLPQLCDEDDCWDEISDSFTGMKKTEKNRVMRWQSYDYRWKGFSTPSSRLFWESGMISALFSEVMKIKKGAMKMRKWLKGLIMGILCKILRFPFDIRDAYHEINSIFKRGDYDDEQW